MGKLQRVADILTLTKDPQYDGQSRTVSQFLASQRGQMLAQEFGTLDGKWHPADWTLVVDTAALARLNEKNILDREKALNMVLRDNGLLNIQFTSSQMAGLSSMVFQGNNAAAGAAAKAIAEGKTGAEICAAAAGANKGTIYANRFNAECSALTNGEITQYYQPKIIKPLIRSDIDGIVEETVSLSSTMVAGGTAVTDAEAFANAQKRMALQNTLSELANNYEGEVLNFTVTDDGLMLFNDNVTLEARFDGSTLAAETSGLVTIAHTVDGKRLTITWIELPDGGREAATILVDGQMISNKPALAALDGYGSELDSVANGAHDDLLAQVAAGNAMLNQTDAASTVTTTLDASGHLVQTVTHDVAGHSVKVEFVENTWGDLTASRVVSVDGQAPANTDAFANALNTQGYSPWDFADGQTPSGGSDLGSIYASFDPMDASSISPPLLTSVGFFIQHLPPHNLRH